MKVSLIPADETAGKREIAVTRPKFLLGRAPDCDVHLGFPVVSRHHCAVLVHSDVVTVRDLGSRHGTFVNDQRVEGSRVLLHGDLLHVATATFEVRIRPPTAVSSGDDGSAGSSLFTRFRDSIARLVSFLASPRDPRPHPGLRHVGRL